MTKSNILRAICLAIGYNTLTKEEKKENYLNKRRIKRTAIKTTKKIHSRINKRKSINLFILFSLILFFSACNTREAVKEIDTYIIIGIPIKLIDD